MDRMSFDNRGISGEFNIATEGELLAIAPFKHTYSWCDGQNTDRLSCTAVSDKGRRFKLIESESASYADNTETDYVGETVPSIGEQVAAIRSQGQNIKYLILHRFYENQNGQEDYEEFHILSDAALDMGRIRRRLEDVLRKDDAAMLKAAVMNDIKMA